MYKFYSSWRNGWPYGFAAWLFMQMELSFHTLCAINATQRVVSCPETGVLLIPFQSPAHHPSLIEAQKLAMDNEKELNIPNAKHRYPHTDPVNSAGNRPGFHCPIVLPKPRIGWFKLLIRKYFCPIREWPRHSGFRITCSKLRCKDTNRIVMLCGLLTGPTIVTAQCLVFPYCCSRYSLWQPVCKHCRVQLLPWQFNSDTGRMWSVVI